MARQKGILKIEGTVGDITFYKTQDGHLVREKGGISADRMKNDPAFQRTRENGEEFGRAGKAGKLLRQAIRPLLINAQDSKLVSRLVTEMMRVIQSDATSTRGLRNVIDGETELLEGFEFNNNGKLGSTLYVAYTTSINRVTGKLTVSLPSFTPTEGIVAPAGTTHFQLSAGGSEVNFTDEVYKSDLVQSSVLPLNTVATTVPILETTVTANSVHPLFLLLGVSFFQEVNGTRYPLKNGAFNALAVVKVSGT